MIDSELNKRSGILVINLPSTDNGSIFAAHGEEEQRVVYAHKRNWQFLSTRSEFESQFPYMPSRITDSLVKGAAISVTRWIDLTPNRLGFLIDATFASRRSCDYDLSVPLRRRNT